MLFLVTMVEMAEVTKLMNSRRAHRIHANRLMKSINDLLKNINLEDEFQVAKLKTYEYQFLKIQMLDDNVISHHEEDAVEEELLKSL